MSESWRLAGLCAVVGTCLASGVGATTMELYGFGPRATALAGTAEAVADDFYATYANPANLVLAEHIHFGFGGDVVMNRFGIDRVAGQDRYPSQLPADNYLGHLGISTPLGGWLAHKAALGIAVHLPLGGATRLDAHDHRTPQLTLYDTLGDRLTLVFGLAVRPLRWLAIGASAQLLTTLTGRADIDLSVLDHRITRKQLDVQLLTKVFPIVGVTVTPNDDLRLSLVWRGESEVRYGLPLHVRIEDFGQLQFAIAGVGLWLPDTVALAASYRRGRWLATAGVAWARWSELPPLAPEVDLLLDDRELVARGREPDAILLVRNEPIAMGAQDILQPRAGVEVRQGDALVWRAGVQYRPTPLPRAVGPANYLDAPATTVTAGVGVRLADPLAVARQPLQVDLAFGWTQLARRTAVKVDPADPVQATSVHGANWHVALGLHHDF